MTRRAAGIKEAVERVTALRPVVVLDVAARHRLPPALLAQIADVWVPKTRRGR